MSTVEDPCTTALGNFGRWQLRAFLIVALVKIPSAWQMASILFIAPYPPVDQFWCARPHGLEDLDVDVWRNISHQWVQDGNKTIPDSCNMYVIDFSANSTDDADLGTTPNYWLNTTIEFTNMTMKCKHFEYASQDFTIVTKWDLVCGSRILVSVSQFFYLFGILVGGFLCVQLLDAYSPRRLILAAMFVQVLAGVGVAYSPYFELQTALRFVTAASCATMFTSGYVICTDLFNGKWRLVMASCYEHFWSIGVILLPVLAQLSTDFRYLQLSISLPTLLVLACFRWIPDSPRWLLKKGRVEEASHILQQAATTNKRAMPAAVHAPDQSKESAPVKWCQLFEQASQPWRCVALHVAWAATVVTYYGALLNVRNLGGDIHLNTGIAALAEVLGVLLGLLLILKATKHKWMYLGVILIIGGSTCLFCWLLQSTDVTLHDWLFVGLAMVGRVAIACSLNTLQVTSSEILPQALRVKGVVSAVTFARLCLLSAPFIGTLAKYGNNVSLSVFGGITVVGGLAVLFIAFTSLTPAPTKSPAIHLRDAQLKVWSINTAHKDRYGSRTSNLEFVEAAKY